jgi:hypothetical protein
MMKCGFLFPFSGGFGFTIVFLSIVGIRQFALVNIEFPGNWAEDLPLLAA